MSLLNIASGQSLYNGVHFERALTWDEILLKAKTENKYIFIDAYATWCGPCKQMDVEVYDNQIVGELTNATYISVKIQMDSTKDDDLETRKWRGNANMFKRQFNINSYPTFLFFNCTGQMIYKDGGFRNASEFIKLCKKALNPQNLIYFKKLDDFRSMRDSANITPALISYSISIGDRILTRELVKHFILKIDPDSLCSVTNILLIKDALQDKRMSDSLATLYISTRLSALSDSNVLTKGNLNFLKNFTYLLSPEKGVFKLICDNQKFVDRVLGVEGWSASLIESVVNNVEFENRLFKNGKAIYSKPNWIELQSLVSDKYPTLDVNNVLLNYQIKYYRRTENWHEWSHFKDIRIAKSKFVRPGLDVAIELNDFGAWDAFLHCNDKSVLEDAVTWIDIAINVDTLKAAYLDTKANLLYKLGRINDAIAIEERAVALADSINRAAVNRRLTVNNPYIGIVYKMKNRMPTYLEEGAVWKE